MKKIQIKFIICWVVISLMASTFTMAQDEKAAINAAQQLSARWQLFKERLQADQLAAASDEINQLVMIRDGAGIGALPEYGTQLVAEAQSADSEGDIDRARILFRWALKIAPETPEVTVQVLPVYRKYGLGSLWGLVKSIVLVTWASPFRLLTHGAQCIYLILDAFSWALYLAFIAVFASDLMSIFRVLAWYVRPALRGLLVPLIFLLLFGVPICLGFLWCLACWSVAVFVIIPERRRLSLSAGMVILAWGVLIPVTENISSWLNNTQVQRVLIASEQPLRDEERQQLESEISLWGGDSVVQFKFAQLLRRAHQIDGAEKILIFLEQSLGNQSWITAERGVLNALRADFHAAEKTLRSSVSEGNSSPEVLFNLSKVVFELENTKESRELFGRALKGNKNRVEQYRKREEMLGIHDPRAYADVELPLITYLQAAIIPNHLSFPRAEAKASQVMWGCDPRLISLVGVLVILMHISRHQRSRRINPKGLFDGYEEGALVSSVVHLVPGGVLLTEQSFRSGFLLLFVMVLSLPPVAFGSHASVSWFYPYHICIWLFAYLLSALWSTQRGRE